MRTLYKIIKTSDGSLELNFIQEYIIKEYSNVHYLFSTTSVASCIGQKRQKVRRSIKSLVKLGIVEKYSGIEQGKNNVNQDK